jgi:hypothetical protein
VLPLPDGDGATLEVGSVPDVDPAAAARAAFALHPALPSVPEMPRRGPGEGILARVMGGLLLAGEGAHARLAVPLEGPALEAALTGALEEVPPPERAAGLPATAAEVRRTAHRGLVKAALVGPAALAETLRDAEGRSAAAVPAAAEAVARFVARRAVALARAVAAWGVSPVVQLDEPGTTDGLSHGEARRVAEVMAAVRGAGARVALHDCGARRGDRALALAPDLLLVDATGDDPPLVRFPAALSAYLARGGSVAWGVVPTRAPFPDGGRAARALLARIAAAGVDPGLARARAWLSPACGLGASSAADAASARAALAEASAAWGGRGGAPPLP